MTKSTDKLRVLFSFPNKVGGNRICYIAWQQVRGLHAAGAEVTLFTGDLLRPVPPEVKVYKTLAKGKLRIPYRLIGSKRAWALHDHIVSRHLENMAEDIDIVHTWPMGALETLKTAAHLGIPTVLERCNAHTGFAYEVVQRECERLGVALPPDHEHAYQKDVLQKEEEEYRLASRLLCPSDFTLQTFLDKGFSPERLMRHFYGFDETAYYPGDEPRDDKRALTMLFVGVCAVRKGVHYALEAWLRSPASKEGKFRIAGEFLPTYAEKLGPMLSHPSVCVLGHRTDVPDLMRQSDILVLPSIEEGFGLVVTEAMGSGCVPLVSDACTEICRHMETGLVHRIGNVDALTQHITMMHEDRALLRRLRENGLAIRDQITWGAAGTRLLEVYHETLAMKTQNPNSEIHSSSEALDNALAP